jgi:hypothetical protein
MSDPAPAVPADTKPSSGATVASFGICFTVFGIVLAATMFLLDLHGFGIAVALTGSGIVLFTVGALTAMPHVRQSLFGWMRRG